MLKQKLWKSRIGEKIYARREDRYEMFKEIRRIEGNFGRLGFGEGRIWKAIFQNLPRNLEEDEFNMKLNMELTSVRLIGSEEGETDHLFHIYMNFFLEYLA